MVLFLKCIVLWIKFRQDRRKMMKKKKIMIITIMLSFLLVTVTALAMQSFSEKTVNDVPQPVQNSIGVNSNMTPSIVRSAVLYYFW